MDKMSLLELEIDRPESHVAGLLSKLCPVVLYSGDSIRPKWRIGKRKLFQNLWVFIGSGKGVFSVGEKEFKVNKNDFVWVPPNTFNEMSGTSDEMRCIWCHLDLLYDSKRSKLFRVPDGVANLEPWKEYIQPPIGDPLIDSLGGLITLANPLHVKTLFQDLCKTHKIEPENSLKLAGIVYEILGEILNSHKRKDPIIGKMDRAVTLIREQLNHNLNVAALAKSVALSDSYFRTVFRKTQGAGPAAFHRELRIHEACNLMSHEGLNVSETAEALGFSGIQSFSRAFKDVMGISPKNYMKDVERR